VRIYISTLELEVEAHRGVREEVLQLRDRLDRAGHQAHLGLDFESREVWYSLISSFDIMLVVLDGHWWSSTAKSQQASDSVRFGIPTYFFALESGNDVLKAFGPEAHLLRGTLEEVPGQLMPGPVPAERRMELAQKSLLGLSVGDAFGETFFGPTPEARERIGSRELRPGPWKWTDDTAQARCVVQGLALRERIDGDTLAQLFLEEYGRDSARGYGAGTHSLMGELRRGVAWRRASQGAFQGSGSYGNGAAMRVAPIGAYFFDQPVRLAQQARLSAIITHWHEEGWAGAEAVALGAAWAASGGEGGQSMLEWVRDRTTESKTRQGIARALDIPLQDGPERAASALGSGQEVSAWDTVPFVLWCAAHYHHSYPEALWATVAGLGDRDTTCAMVGGIVALSATVGVPQDWLEATESL
jgi:ADP-ribosylglycohydrolase